MFEINGLFESCVIAIGRSASGSTALCFQQIAVVNSHATAEWIAQQIVVNRFAGVSQLFWVCGRDRAKGGRSFAGTCALYENECRARRTQRGANSL